MGDALAGATRGRPDRAGLFQLASGQRGYFTAAQARGHGFSRALLAHHARTGTLRRVRTGLYRFRDYPSTPREEVVAAWLSVGRDDAAVSHESADLHVTGAALYTQDLVGRTLGPLHAWPVQAPHAHARVAGLRTGAAYDVPGVVRVLTAEDVPGLNDAGEKHDEPLFPDEVMFYGHAVCWVLGETLEAARQGADQVEVDYEPLPALVSVHDAIEAGSYQGHQRR